MFITKAALITMFVAAVPILELRASIPLAMLSFKMGAVEALIYSVIGSILPVFPILFLLEYVEPFIRKSKALGSLLDKVFERTRSKSQMIKELEFIGLVLFIGVPLPGTGVWTGTFAAYLFGMKKWQALIAGVLGTTIAGVIMVFLSTYIDLIIKYGLVILAVIAAGVFLANRGKKKSKKISRRK